MIAPHPFRAPTVFRNGCCLDCGAYEEDGAHTAGSRSAVHHIDGDPTNNYPRNLRLVPIAENIGACDTCDRPYDNGSRLDHCGDCGNCYDHCACDCDHEHVETEDVADGVVGNGAAHVLAAHCADCGAALVDDGEMDDDGVYRPSWSILEGPA